MTQTRLNTEDLKDLIGKKTMPEIAEHFGISLNALRYQLKKMNIRVPNPHTRSLEENRKIYRYSETHGLNEAAERFGLSYQAIKEIRKRVLGRQIKAAHRLDSEFIRKLRKRAQWLAQNSGRGQLGPDFGSYVVIKTIEGREAALAHLWVDFLRDHYGDPRSPGGKAKSTALHGSEEITDRHEEIASPTYTRWNELAEEFCSNVRERVCFLLHYQHGFELSEIGDLYGSTQSRICQILKPVRDKVTQSLMKEKE